MPTDIKALRKLLAAATEEPWRLEGKFWIECDSCGEESCCHDVASCDEYETAYIQACGIETFATPNAELIVALRNVAPELLDELEMMRGLLRCFVPEKRKPKSFLESVQKYESSELKEARTYLESLADEEQGDETRTR